MKKKKGGGAEIILKSGYGCTFASSTRAAESRTRQKGIIVKSSVLPL